METAMRNVTINDRAATPKSKDGIDDNDQPLDFSKRVQKSFEADTLRKVSQDSAVSLDLTGDHANDDNIRRVVGRMSDIPPSVPSISTMLPQQHAALASMGMFYPSTPVFPNLMAPGFPQLWPNSIAAAAFLQQQEAAKKFLQHTAHLNKTIATSSAMLGVRPPFLGKDSMINTNPLLAGARFPGLGTPAGIPSAVAANSNGSSNGVPVIPDPTILAEAFRSHEEMFTAYKQQVLSQKAAEEARKGPRKAPSATVTSGKNGHVASSNGMSHCATEMDVNTQKSSVPTIATGANTPSTITENVAEEENAQESVKMEEEDACSVVSMATSTNNGDEYGDQSGGGYLDDDRKPHISHKSLLGAAASAITAIGSSDDSQASDSALAAHRRSLTPSQLHNNEFGELNAMRPRSSTLPTQMCESRKLSCSPAPSHMSNGNSNSGPCTPNSKGSFRKRARTLPDEQKDEAYWERRRKNNEAAKRSRDSRRAKEDEIAIRAAFLEQENLRLRVELAALRQQTAKLRSELIIMQGPDELRGVTDPVKSDGA